MFNTIITVEGLNAENLVNNLSRSYKLSIIKRTRKVFDIVVAHKDSKKLVAYLKNKCYNIINIKQIGIVNLWYKVKSHIALTICLILLIVSMLVCNNLCLDIHIKYNGKEQEVKYYLNEYGIKYGSNLASLSIDKLENFLCNKLNCAYAVVSVRGSRLSVQIVDKTTLDKPTDFNKSFDIIATHSGVITRIVVLSGTAQVKVGDKVSKGQTLIKGLRTYADGTQEPIRAVGSVYADVAVWSKAEYSPTQIIYNPTNKFFTRTHLKIGDKIAFSKRKNPYTYSKQEETTYSLFPFNIVVIRQIIYELAPQTISVTLEEVKDELMKKAYEQAVSQIDYQIINTEYIIDNSGVTAYIYGNIQINKDNTIESNSKD
ncbi:MAG: sporulation protein YqfD [Clostridia bacterium]